MLDVIMPAMITPFDEHFEATERVAERCIEACVDGLLYILGSAGEFPHLSS